MEGFLFVLGIYSYDNRRTNENDLQTIKFVCKT